MSKAVKENVLTWQKPPGRLDQILFIHGVTVSNRENILLDSCRRTGLLTLPLPVNEGPVYTVDRKPHHVARDGVATLLIFWQLPPQLFS